MRARLIVAAGACLAAMVPLAAGASATSGDLALSPAHGASGSHFTATFTFTETPCSAFVATFFWDVPDHPQELGHAAATGSGPTCVVSLDLVVPSTDAAPNRSYPVSAYAQTQQVNAGNSSAVMSSSKDSGDAQFEVTGPAPSDSAGGPSPSSPSHGTTTGPTGTSTGSTSAGGGPSPAASDAATSPGIPDSSASPDAGSSSGNGGTTTPPLAVRPPATPAGPRGSGGTILLAVAVLALLVAAAWAQRTGRLRTLLRR